MATVTDIIDRLYKLATRIRNTATRSVQSRHNLYKDIDPEFREIMMERLVNMETARVQENILQSRHNNYDRIGSKMPDPVIDDQDRILFRRLGMANHYRRRQFIYWRRRKEKGEIFTANPVDTEITTHDPVVVDRINVGPGHKPQIAQSHPSSVTKLDERHFDITDRKSTISNVTRTPSARGGGGEKVEWPAFPKGVPDVKFFECPFCFNLCPKVYRNDTAWK
jgi:hypothetical protein